ncbi:alpha/beta hydrolase, partial [Actinosynnema sp. NPDC020468]|uniref:alpha/beta hydrolase n=1 Tax=Actinosynnema sp. NPDC020468 TaxID=3154488 RepID=UPI0033FCC055
MNPELRLAAAAFPPDDLSDVPAARARALEFDRSRAAARPLDTYDLSADGVPVRVYAPAGPPGTRPVLLWFHGGAFVLGGLTGDDRRCARLAARTGAVVVAVDFDHGLHEVLLPWAAGRSATLRQSAALG